MHAYPIKTGALARLSIFPRTVMKKNKKSFPEKGSFL
jgi:hypothetical protein